jgi:diguanylate cyclase (GGDEF)-like protein/PAS domain S-box-containing protein
MYNLNKLTARFNFGLSVWLIFFLTLIFSSIQPVQSSESNFRIYTEEFPPYNYTTQGKITGISTEIVREILHRLDHSDNIEISSWSRAYRLLQKKDNIILYSTTRSPIREDLFKWVGPLVPNNTVFFARAASNISIKTLNDARKVGRIGVYKDDFGELLLKDKDFTNLRSIPDNRENLKDLINGKIDLWIINELTGNHFARQAGLLHKIEKVFAIQKDFMYLAFSKSTPDSVINKWQIVLDEIKADGTYAQIFSKWIMFSFSEDLNPTNQIVLNKEEQAWIDEHPTIKMATDPDYPPFQFTNKGGQSRGIANDYLTLMGNKLGINFEPVLTKRWDQSQKMVQKHEADMLAVASETVESNKYLLFTEPYLEFPDVIIVRNNDSEIATIDRLKGKTLASVAGFAVNDFLRQNYPEIKVVEKPDTQSLLKSVSTGEVDAATLNLATTSYQIEKEKISNLRVSSKTGFSYKLAFASRNDWPLLNQILEKALASLTDEEKKEIERKWISLSNNQSRNAKVRRVQLTKEERSWINKHPVISFSPDPDWPPIEYFDKAGKHTGITADYISLLEDKLGISFKAKQLKTWQDILNAAKDRDIDMISAAVALPDREEYMQFTKPFLHLPSVIIVDNKVKGSLTMEDLKGKTVSVVTGFSSHDYMKNNYPEIILDPVFNTVEGLRKVAFGKSYALVANIATSTFLMEKEVMPNLRIAGESGYTFNLSIASRKDWPILNRIINKGLDSITREERQGIYKKWISRAEKPWITIKQFIIGLAIFLGVGFVVSILFWNRQLSNKVEKRTAELNASKENFKNLYETALVGLFRTSLDGTKIYTANPAFAELFGYDNYKHVIKNYIPKNSYVDPVQRKSFIKQLRKEGQVKEFEFLGRCLDGSERNFIMSAFISKDENHLEGAILDITERKKNEEIIRKLAMTDPLTGLANRNQFNVKLKEALAQSKRSNSIVSLILIDLDDFKPVNDNYGHPVGDELLLHVAKELNDNFREVDTIARLGGDEFAVVLNEVKSFDDAEQLAEKILTRFMLPIKIGSHSIHIGASIGLCFFPDDADNIEDMLTKVDRALYKAKALGKNQVCLYGKI